MNYLQLLFAQMTLVMIVFSSLMNTIENYLPVFIARTFRYGKFAYEGPCNNIIKPIEVPKSWFKHYYIFSSIASLTALIFIINAYIFNNAVPELVVELLNKVAGSNRNTTATPTATLLAIALLTLQCCRRFYDTQFVSVFGVNSRMNLSHYFVGFAHYAGAILAILAEAPKFTISTDAPIQFSHLSYPEFIGTGIFLWAWVYQYKATVILANLRKNINGKIVSSGHHIPEGGLFKYVSSPHLLTEILMYLSILIILWKNTTWWLVFVWVLSNQVEVALLSQWWYQKTFPNYPKDRKILIPYIF